MNSFRRQIDAIDRKLLSLLAQRIAVAKKIGAYKKRKGLAVRDPAREKELEAKALVRARSSELDPIFVRSLWKRILRESRRIQNLK